MRGFGSAIPSLQTGIVSGIYMHQYELNVPDSAADEWWGSATADSPDRAIHIFLTCLKLRVEDCYVTNADVVGSYAECAGGNTGGAMKYYNKFLKAAKANRVFPPWWDDSREAVGSTEPLHLHAATRGLQSVDGHLDS